MNTTSIVRLTDDERQELFHLTKSGKAAASQIKHAHHLAPRGCPRASRVRCARGHRLALSWQYGAQRPSTLCCTRTRGRCGPPKAGHALAPVPPGWRQRRAGDCLAVRSAPPRPRHVDLPVTCRPTRRAPRGRAFFLPETVRPTIKKNLRKPPGLQVVGDSPGAPCECRLLR